MTTKVTPRLIELTYEATLKSYWRKAALRKFISASGVNESFISTWDETESKREFLDRLFHKLQAAEKGDQVIYGMANNLSEQTTFPDLRNWEDSREKIQNAHKAVEELKQYLKKAEQKTKIEEDKKEALSKARKRKQEIRKALTDKSKLQENLNALHTKVGTQQGGYEFEKWFYELLTYSEITHRPPYKIDGRQIDGSLTLDGTTYLIELKFTKNQSSSTDIDSLKAKVNKMADNTMGIMVSISGYSSTAISEASGNKTTLLLFDSSHLYLFLSGSMKFEDIITRVRRHASQTGEAFLPVAKFNG